MDKDRKKQLRNHFKEQEQAAARQALGLLLDQLRDLRAHIEHSIAGQGLPCDHTLTRTREWAIQNALDPERVAEGVRSAGAFCDCEVALNLHPHEFGLDELPRE